MALQNWPMPSVAIGVETDLVVPMANKEVVIIGLIIQNTSTTLPAAVNVVVTTNGNIYKAHVFMDTLSPGANVCLDTKVCLAAAATPDKIRVRADQTAVSFLASGDMS